MDEKALIEFLKKNLTIHLVMETFYDNDAVEITVSIKLGDTEITRSSAQTN